MAKLRPRLGVRARILAIALVPSMALLVAGIGAAGYLVEQARQDSDWAAQMLAAIPPTSELVEAVHQERHLTMTYLAGDDSAMPALTAARAKTNSAFAQLIDMSADVRSAAHTDIGDDLGGFAALGEHLTGIRTAVDARQLPSADAYDFYNRMLDVVRAGAQIAHDAVPDAEIGKEVTEGFRLFYTADAMARAHTLAYATVTAGGQPPLTPQEFLDQVGFYRTMAGTIVTEPGTSQGETMKAIMGTPAWAQLAEMENAVIARLLAPADSGTARTRSTGEGTEAPLPLSMEQWRSAAGEVHQDLLEVYTGQSLNTQALAERKASDSARASLYGGGGVLLVSIAALLIALFLANRVIRRLKRLRDETMSLADDNLPTMMRRLRAGERIDLAAETPRLDYGDDEIGEVAKAFEHAHAAAVEAAVDEARTREGVKAVFLNIAHRSQVVVHRQLEILDEAEARQEDPALLETLFKLDHLATRERRNAENLIILGGEQPGRQWRHPISLIDLVRSSIAETVDFARVRITKLPDVHVPGTVVADLVHLLSELVDNATSFSPPQSKVEISGNVVGRGVVVEISDQGMGLPAAELQRLNEMLSDPPDFGLAALSVNSRLGLFVVAQLGRRHGVTVRLADSDYGGIRAIVLIPTTLLATPDAPLSPVFAEPAGRSWHSTAHAEPPMAWPTPGAVLTVAPPEPPLPPPTPQAAVGTTPDGRPALPKRTRQANLAPELANPSSATPATSEREQSAEQARDLMSAIENGTRQGRRAQPTDQQKGVQ
ncbi:nitrate- and nitrite sensing domain-containing protein [Nocardia sp. NPDC058176]|uniref:sensor histidine kinase n=1 Tax=Nocardia sp. NPDC058176 TaxID=3346368 RepID=UPI0036DC23F6